MRVRNRRRLSYLLLIAAAAALGPVRASHAAAYTYSTRQRTINAGVLIVDDAGPASGMNDSPTMGASDPDPYVFYVLNQRSDIKPLGWNIVNPLAAPSVTGDILARWNARTANAAGGQAFLTANGNSAYQLYQRITPNMAPYWEVSLSRTGLDDLLQFDVLLLNLQGHTLTLTLPESEKLRRFIDGGGQLWIEDSGGGNIVNPETNPVDVQFSNTSAPGRGILPPAFGTPTLLRHPIVATPYLLSDNEINSLGSPSLGGNGINYAIAGRTSSGQPDPTLLINVVENAGASNLPVICAGQMGAGQVVVTTTGSSAAINNAVGGINCGFGPNSGPFCGNNFGNAPIPDLKLLTDILSWDTAHPTEHKTSHQSSQSRGTLGPAVTPIWNYTPAPPAGSTGYPVTDFTPGAAINGDFVYVRGVDGLLHAFNARPGTDLLGTGTPDAGIQDYIKGYPYDEIWNSGSGAFPGGKAPLSVGPDSFASAPTVASVPVTPSGGSSAPIQETLVFFEGSDGTVYAADSITGTQVALPGSQGPGAGGYNATTGPAPAPTVYGGRVYAGRADGTLYIYDFNAGSAHAGVTYPVANGATIIAPPTIGVIRDPLQGSQADDIVAAVTTTGGIYTLELGSRHDNLHGGGTSYNIYAARPGALPLMLDTTGALMPQAFGESNFYPIPAGTSTGSSTFTLSPSPPGPPAPYFAYYDVDFSQSSNDLHRAMFSINSPNGGTATGFVSAPALAPNGNLYYTVNVSGSGGVDSTLVCARDFKLERNLMRWRFRLPFAGEAAFGDADGNIYSPADPHALNGFQFAGAPVVDTRGNVFALAFKGSQAAILAFNGNQEVTLQAFTGAQVGQTTGVSVQSLSQPVPGGASDEFGVTPPQTIQSGQLGNNGRPDNNGLVTITTFGVAGAQPGVINPNLSEPQPVTVVFQQNGNAANGGTVNQTNVNQPLHTNMSWYTVLPTQGAISPAAGLTLVGKYLFFGDMAGNLYRFYAYPGDSGLIGGNRFVPITDLTNGKPITDNNSRPIFASVPTNGGAINGVPSAGSNLMVVNTTRGVVALGSRYTLAADSNRVLEADSEGVASWAVDATSHFAPNGAVTHLELNHPASVTELAPNDYLVADTGNNRCVRFDRSGNVLWELSRFNDFADPSTQALFNKSVKLLAPGEPTTLNHPTSVESYITYARDSNNNVTGTVVHYLIADTGNYRILEVVDAYDAKGNPVGPPHNLVWLSHTYDRQGRHYGYTSASYFTGPDGKQYVAALVTNLRLAQIPPAANPATGQLGPASNDAPGSSLVLLDYAPGNALGTATFGTNGQADGFIAHAISTYYAYFQSGGKFDLDGAPKLTPPTSPNLPAPRQPAATGTPTLLYLHNPRFLQTYTPPGGTGALQNFLIADDNGVFDLFLDTAGTFVPANHFVAQWGFTQADYRDLRTGPQSAGAQLYALIDKNVPLSTKQLTATTLQKVYPLRNGYNNIDIYDSSTNTDTWSLSPQQAGPPIAFLPNSIQRSGTDTVTDATGTFLMGHYVVTNGFSQGFVTPTVGFGGEALELNDVAVSGAMQTQSPASFSKPGGTSPLAQPAFAVREK